MEFTEKDWEMIAQAVAEWETSPMIEGAFGSLVDGAFISKEDRPRQIAATMDAAKKKADGRRNIAIILKAKIELARQAAQAEAIDAAGGTTP
jgi:hypothetical protein